MFSLESCLLTYLDVYRYVRPGYSHFEISYGAPKNYLAMILEGHGRLHSAGNTFDIAAGDILFIPQGCVYSSEWFPDGEACVLYSVGFIFRAQDENISYPIQKLSAAAEERALFDALYRDAEAYPYRAAASFFTLYDRVQEQLIAEAENPLTHSITPALLTMTNRVNSSIPVPVLAKMCNMSESAFYAAFRHRMGQTPVEYNNMLRCRKAVHMLTTTDYSVEIIAGLIGCSTPSYLRRLLRQYIGKTPREIRRDIGGI